MKHISKETIAGVEYVVTELNGARYRRLSDANSFKWQRQWGSGWTGITQAADELERRYWLMGTPPTLTKTVRVRVCVAVSADGDWGAKGWFHNTDPCSIDDAMAFIPEGVPSQLFWLTAELPIPVPAVVQADIVTS